MGQVWFVIAAHAARFFQGGFQCVGFTLPTQCREVGHALLHKMPSLFAPWPFFVKVGHRDTNHQGFFGQVGWQWAQAPRVNQPNISSFDHGCIGCAVPPRAWRRGKHGGFIRRWVTGLTWFWGKPLIRRLMGYLRQSFVRGIYDTAWAVPWHRCITRHIFCIEQVWLGAAGACHPLPAEVIAGQVTIEQVAVEPIGTRTPMDFSHMHHVACQPHAGMVMHAAGFIKSANRHVHGVHTRLGLSNVMGDRPAVLVVWQWAAVQ